MVVLLVVSKAEPTSKNTSATSDAEIKFNQFATYLLYGKESNSLSGEYESDKSYEIDLQLENEEFDSGYWDKASELLDSAIVSAKDDSKITRYLVKSLQNYKQYFDFIKQYRQIGKFDEEHLLSSYLSSGVASANVLVDNFYNRFGDSNFSIATNYINNRRQQYRDTIEVYAIYNELGCIYDREIIESKCTNAPSTATAERFVELFSSMGEAKVAADRSIQNAVTYLKNRCWELSTWLQNPVDERDGDGDES